MLNINLGHVTEIKLVRYLFYDADEVDGGASVNMMLIGAQDERFRHRYMQMH